MEEHVKLSEQKAKVILINPSFYLPWSKCEPTGLLYVASYLESKGIKVKVLDLNIQEMSLKDILNTISYHQPQIVGITALTRQVLSAYSLGKTIKENFKCINLVYGGVHPTFLPKECFEEGAADYVVLGEGEHTLYELFCVLENGEEITSVQGIAYQQYNEICLTQKRKPIENLDEFPFPNYDLIPLEQCNSNIHLKEYQKQAVHIMSSRGCPYNCVYCCSPGLYGRKVRFRSAHNVLAEIESITKKHRITTFHFHDDNFLLDHKRVLEFCELVSTKEIKFDWICLARTDAIVRHPEVLKPMRQAGCVGIEIGVETGDEFVFYQMNRMQPDLSHIKEANELLKSHDIHPMYLIISYGLGENIDSAYKTARFYYELKLSKDIDQIPPHNFDKDDPDLGGHLMRPSPGAAFYDIAGENGICLAKTWQEHIEQNMTFIPNEFLIDIPIKNIALSKGELLETLMKYKGNMQYYAKQDLYISEPIIEEKFGDFDSFIQFLQLVYEHCDGEKTTKELSDDLEKKYCSDLVMTVSTIAILSILRLVRSKDERIFSHLSETLSQ